MKVAFDIGGVLSKYPDELRNWVYTFQDAGYGVFVITDMHDRREVLDQLRNNGFRIPEDYVYTADYDQYGEMCKAVLLSKLGINVFIDDFPGYLQWDRSLGPAPIRLLVQPDAFRPYWHESWQVLCKSDFGRRFATPNQLGESLDRNDKQ